MKLLLSRNLPLIAFISLGVIWGSNFIYMKWASEHITALQVVLARVLFGFIPVVLYAIKLKVIKLEHLKYSVHFFIMSLLGTTVYYYFFVKASSLLLSGVAGALSGSIPLFTFVLALFFIKEEKLNLYRILGITIGFIGVVLIANPFNTNLQDTNVEGVVSIILGSLVIGASFVYAKKFITPLNIHFAALTTYQLGFALLLLLLVTDFNGIESITNDTHVLIGLILGLGLLGTGLAYIIYYYIIEKIGAVNAASVTYIPPIIALIISFLFIGEKITLLDCFSTTLIFAGVFLINKKEK